jgi:DNA-binding NtrC family response regulator
MIERDVVVVDIADDVSQHVVGACGCHRSVGAWPLRPARGLPRLPAAGGPAYNPKSMNRVLIIEDDELIRQMLQMALAAAGWEVTVAVDGDDGLSVFSQQAFDLVICDVIMPRKYGIEVLRGIRAVEPSLPVIMMTGESFRDPSVDVSALGGLEPTFAIEKPFRPSEIVYFAAECIRGSRRE